MKVSYNWLKTHVALEMSAQDLAGHLLKLGFEVAGIQRLGSSFSGVVVGKVLSREKHPNADKLSVCVVDDGARKWNVVCGAPNVAAGQTVAYARIGAVLPGGFKIEGRKLRGVESEGMICSRTELGLPADVDGIWVMGEGPALGVDVSALLGPADDVLEVEIGSNRPDCLSHRGLARELAAYFKLPLKPLETHPAGGLTSPVPVKVEDQNACPYYSARLIEGVKNGESPAWLKARLEAIGLRPISAIADVTNFVLHDVGQPLHAFDANKIKGGITVRRARRGEKLKALDHKTYDLAEGLLVIADAEAPVALGGVMGGEDSAVTAATTRVLLEAAYFAPSEARRSSQKTRLRSDSSYRYERGADPEAPRAASDRAAALITQLCGGKSSLPASAAKTLDPRPSVRSTAAKINQVLGSSFPPAEVHGALKSIAAEFREESGGFVFSAPSWRRDLATANDLAEEVGRFLGLDAIPFRLAPAPARAARLAPVEQEARRVRTRLAALGLCEAYNYDLLSEKTLALARLPADAQPRVANPLSEDWAVLRPSLLPGLLRNAAYNLNRGADAVRLFELGKAYAKTAERVDERWRVAGLLLGPVLDARWQPARAPRAGFADAKAAVEELLSRAGAVSWVRLDESSAGKLPSDPLFHPANSLRAVAGGRPVATVGWLHPRAARAFELEREGVLLFDADLEWLADRPAARTQAQAISPFPPVRRDLALVVDESVPYARLEAALRKAAGPDLRDVELFDLYQGKGVEPGKKSLAVRLTFGRMDRTLIDSEVAKAVEQAVAAAAKELGATLRA